MLLAPGDKKMEGEELKGEGERDGERKREGEREGAMRREGWREGERVGDKEGWREGGSVKEEERSGRISFTFTRTAPRPPRARPHNMTGVGGSVVRGGPVVVPLIGRTRWRAPVSEPVAVREEGAAEDADEADVVSRAVQELIEESRRFRDGASEGSGGDATLNVPLLVQNQPPPGYEDGPTVNTTLRPQPSTAEEYESVPVEEYGLAMLRGMGWKEGEGIGKTFRREVKPLVQAIRPRGLGLGAASYVSGVGRGEVDPLCLGPGSSVRICRGPHRGLQGKIEGLDADNARAMVRLDLGERVVTISQHSLEAVSCSQDQPTTGSKTEGQRNSERETERESDTDHKLKRRRRDDGEESTGSGPPLRVTWLRSDLLVRLIDRNYKGGSFYNAKLTVEDVVGPTSCVCRTNDGKLLDGIKQSMLETVIPKAECDPIMVVKGEHSGSLGRVLQRDGDRCLAVVQLYGEDEQLLKLHYHSVCQYTGPTGED